MTEPEHESSCLGCLKCCSSGGAQRKNSMGAQRKSSMHDVLDEKIAKRVKSLVNAMSPKPNRNGKGTNACAKCCHLTAHFCCNIIFLLLNIVMLMSGLCITAMSGYLYYSMATLRMTSHGFEFQLPVATFIFGSLIIVLAVFGFACTGRPHCLVLYSSCLVLIMLLEILLALHIYVNYAEGRSSMRYRQILRKVFRDSLDRYSDDIESWKFVDMVQKNFGCCGVNSSEDWYTTPLRMIPDSCCESDCTLFKDKVYPKGCPEKIESVIKDKEETCYLLTTLAMPVAVLYTVVAIPINNFMF